MEAAARAKALEANHRELEDALAADVPLLLLFLTSTVGQCCCLTLLRQ